jgi:hypothetical protein
MERFLSGMPARYDVARGNVKLCGAIVELDEDTGRALKIERIQEPF